MVVLLERRTSSLSDPASAGFEPPNAVMERVENVGHEGSACRLAGRVRVLAYSPRK